MTTRLLVLIAMLLSAAAYTGRAMTPEVVPARQPLGNLPLQLADWRGEQAPPLESTIVTMLGVDDYLNRIYVHAGLGPIGVYIGYYQSQRQGDSIHSPLNCLPGAGWQPVTSGRLELALPNGAAPAVVNQILIQKGLDRQVVLYWYQSQGRVVASEYASKAYLLYDAARLNRSDAAMIRVLSPVLPSEDDDRAAAARAAEFARELLPRLGDYLPS